MIDPDLQLSGVVIREGCFKQLFMVFGLARGGEMRPYVDESALNGFELFYSFREKGV